MNQKKHKCGFMLELHVCGDDDCTKLRLAETLTMIADLFVTEAGPCCEVEERSFPVSIARQLATLLNGVREALWPYGEIKDVWWRSC